jgi:hypothetical protein
MQINLVMAKPHLKRYHNFPFELLLEISGWASVVSSGFLEILQSSTPLTGSKGLPQLIIGLGLNFSMKITDSSLILLAQCSKTVMTPPQKYRAN